MAVAATSLPSFVGLSLKVPAEFAKASARKMALRMLLFALGIEALLTLYGLHAGHERFLHLSLIVFFTAFLFKPWLSLSSNNWVYAFNDKGVYLRDTSDVINALGFPILKWDCCRLSSFQPGEWHGWPALNVEVLHKGRQSTKLFVFRPEEQRTVDEVLIPWLITKLPITIPNAVGVS